MTGPMWIAARTKDSHTKKFPPTSHLSPFWYKRSLNSKLVNTVLQDTGPPSSQSAGFLNKVNVPCPSNFSLNLMPCCVVSSMSFELVNSMINNNYNALQQLWLVGCTCGLCSCGAWAWLGQSMWDFPEAGIEPVSSALAGEVLTTGPPGKS